MRYLEWTFSVLLLRGGNRLGEASFKDYYRPGKVAEGVAQARRETPGCLRPWAPPPVPHTPVTGVPPCNLCTPEMKTRRVRSSKSSLAELEVRLGDMRSYLSQKIKALNILMLNSLSTLQVISSTE